LRSPHTSLEWYSTIVFSMSMSSVSVILGILGFECIVPKVDASLVILLKWASYDLLLLLDSFGNFWYNSTKYLEGSAFSGKMVWTTTFMTCKCLALAFPLTFDHVIHVPVVAFVFLEFTKFLLWVFGPSLFHYPSHYSEPLAGEHYQQSVDDDFSM
jgi:hypothetical protein